jgi:hypothetical protein
MPGEAQAAKQTDMVCPFYVMSSLNKQRLIKSHLEGFVTPSSQRTLPSYSYLLVINLQILLSHQHRGHWRSRRPFRCARIKPLCCLASSRETHHLPSGQCPCKSTQCCYFAWSTRWRSWLRHCATSQMVASSIPNGVIGIFH